MPKLFHRTNTQTAKKTLAIFRSELAKDKKSFLLYSTLMPLNRLLYIAILPLIFSYIIQSLITHPNDWQYPTQLLVIASVVSALALVCNKLGFRRLYEHEERMRTSLMKHAIDNLMQRSDQFFANRKVGSLSGDIGTFSNSIVSFLDIIFLSATGIIVNFTASLVIIGFMSPILLLPLGTVTILLVLMNMRSVNRRGPLRHERKVLNSQLNGTIADILGNHQIVRFFATSDKEIHRVLDDRLRIEQVTDKEIDVVQHESINRQAILFSFQIVTLASCIWLFSSNLVSIAALIFAVTYLGRLTGSLFDLTPIIRNVEQAFLDAANITDILSEPIELTDDKNSLVLDVKGAAVTFRDVSFAYKDNHDDAIIHNLSLSVKAGERIGLAGYSGGGKTTLTKLLLRFADINSGAITIDDQDISKVTQKSLRENIAYVPQEAYLFHRSLRENIAYGRQNATDNEIWTAIKRANASEFIDKLPEGLDTIVGERGIKLSGGQRQRVAIARAILKDAPILVLDEATSALDSESESLIQDALAKLMKGRTSIVIAHRLSTIANLDRIIVLDNGKIAEQGTHQQLLSAGGIYANLWRHQSGGFINGK